MMGFDRIRAFGAGFALLLASAAVEAAPVYSYSDANVSDVAITPFTYAGTIQQFYGYNSPNSATANLPVDLTVSRAAIAFMVEDGAGDSHFVFIMSRANDGQGGSVDIDFTSTGLAGQGLTFEVKDDPGDWSWVWNNGTGASQVDLSTSACCTDGFALGAMPTSDWILSAAVIQTSGFDNFYVISNEGGGPVYHQIAAGFDFSVSYDDGETVVGVPAPATLALFGVGLAGLARLRRWRR